MPRGGKRNGAGAPTGNLNALIHALRSKQVPQAIENALQDPEGRARVIQLLRRYHQPTRPPGKHQASQRPGGKC